MKILPEPIKFEWDQGNENKSLLKHGVSDTESEEVFYDKHKKLYKDKLHSGQETRYILIGQTKQEKLLFIVFTKRKNKIRVISTRDLNKKEKQLYETTT